MDKRKLERWANGATAKAVVKYFAARKRAPKEGVIDVYRVGETLRNLGIAVVGTDLAMCFKELEEAGVGKFIKGNSTKGIHSRFRFTVDMEKIMSVIHGHGGGEGVAIAPEPKSDLLFRLMTDINAALDQLRPEEVELLVRFLKTRTQVN